MGAPCNSTFSNPSAEFQKDKAVSRHDEYYDDDYDNDHDMDEPVRHM
jgi:hypothetical protein